MLHTLLTAPAPAMLWMGNNGFVLSDGTHLIATDLDLHLNERLWPPAVSAEELAAHLDLLMITHGHTDHFNPETVRCLLRAGRCRFLIPESCREIAKAIHGLEERALFCKPGQQLNDPILVKCLRAVHGHIGGSVYSGASMLDCGYRFVFGGLRFYQPGDTLLLEEHLDMHDVDVLFVSPTEHNMGVENAVRLIRSIGPKAIVLQHHSTYAEHPDNRFWAHGYVNELLHALSPEERARCIVPDPHRIIQL